MKHPSKHVWIDDTQGFMANLLCVYIGYHDTHGGGFVAQHAKPNVTLKGKGPIYHPFVEPVPPTPPKKKPLADYEVDPAPAPAFDSDACAWYVQTGDTATDYICGLPEAEHGTPRLEPVIDGWTQYQTIVPEMVKPGEDTVGLRIPTQYALELGEALVAWAKQSAGKDEVGPEAVTVVAEALVHERARTQTLMDAIIDIAKSATGTEDASPPIGDLFPPTPPPAQPAPF